MSIKEAKTQFLIDAACDLFLSNSIFDVTIKDVAIKAGVGEMTIYRHFEKKVNLVLAVAMKLVETIESKYFSLEGGKTGFEKLSCFYESYLTIFQDSPELYRFISEFDAFIKAEGKDAALGSYEMRLDRFHDRFIQAYELGLADGSVKRVDDVDMLYYASAHALLELCKKLSFAGDLLEQDRKIEKGAEIRCLIDVFLSVLSSSRA